MQVTVLCYSSYGLAVAQIQEPHKAQASSHQRRRQRRVLPQLVSGANITGKNGQDFTPAGT